MLPPELRKLDDVRLLKRLARLAKPQPPSDDAAVLPLLTDEQAAALRQLGAPPETPQRPTLLQGVTGSGKTEVYLRSAATALAAGRQVLVLVPEINLTPQLEARFAERFGVRRMVTLHSALTPAQRLRHWLLAHRGQADLVLGTRLAVFASLPRLGLIVVDEEHDPSFKQQEGARYSARDLAVYRGRLEGVPVVLGSATPSLESWAHAEQGRYRRLRLAQRIGGGALPDSARARHERRAAPGRPHAAGAGAGAAAGHRAAHRARRAEPAAPEPARLCAGAVLRRLRLEERLPALQRLARVSQGRPHAALPPLRLRPSACRAPARSAATSTSRRSAAAPSSLQEQIAALLPQRRVARIDADSTRIKGALQAQLTAVHAGEVDVLVGTQMIAKGHDFRRITLVAAVNPDAALFASDFRAAERLFALLMQAGGRAGRDAAQAASSEMWIQTWHPRHALYAALRAHDFDAFARGQLDERRAAGLPPFSQPGAAARRSAQCRRRHRLLARSRRTGRGPEWRRRGARVSAGAAAGVARGRCRAHADAARIADSRRALQALLALWLPQLHALRARHRPVQRWAVDVDPLAI